MALGYCPALLVAMEAITGCATPSQKITTPGFLLGLLNNAEEASILNTRFDNGHYRDLTVKYRQRTAPSQASAVQSCTTSGTIPYQESTLPALQYRQIGFDLPISDIERFCEDASQLVNPNSIGWNGQAPSSFMLEHVTMLRSELNGLIGALDQALLTSMIGQFGVNVATGSAAAAAWNIPLNSTNNNLSQGISELLHQIQQNEMCDFWMFGSGLMSKFDLQQDFMNCCNQAGLNYSNFKYEYYNDLYAQTLMGLNQFGVVEKGAVQLVQRNSFLNNKGMKHGNSYYGTVNVGALLPDGCCQNNAAYNLLNLDVQLIEKDCPTPMYSIIIGKHFGLFTIPTNAYQASDRLNGGRGSLRYTTTNV